MKQIKASLKEVKILQALAEQHKYKTGETISVKPFYSGKVLMVEAPSDFLILTGF